MNTFSFQILASFNPPGGNTPMGSLTADAAGNLYGTTSTGGPGGAGTVFELAKTATGYGPVQTLASFGSSPTDGQVPSGGLVADAAGNLFGATSSGGLNNDGIAFELPKTASGYGARQTVADFNTASGSAPAGNLVVDAAGNLYGTAQSGGAGGDGTVFEIPKTALGYGTPRAIVSFTGSNGSGPLGGLIADAQGNLFGTTLQGGSMNVGTVFEIAAPSQGSTPTLTTLATFDVFTGVGGRPFGGLATDAAGNLFGTTSFGGTGFVGTVFEIAKTASGYAPVETLASLDVNGSGGDPMGGVGVDSAGNLYGTTSFGGPLSSGEVFAIPKTPSGYGPLQMLVTSQASTGVGTRSSLFVDGAGNLFGTASGGGSGGGGAGTVFELVNTTPPPPPPPPSPPSGGSSGPTVSTTPSAGPDLLVGQSGNDTIAGQAGDDTILGGGGNDLLLGNQGNDVISAGDGNSTILGGQGDDRITVGNGANLLYGNEGADTIAAGNGGNTIVGGSGNSLIDSVDGADLITSGSGNDLIFGNGGDDTVVAGGGADTVVGGFGRDIILGNQGDDILLGNQGDDTLYGGYGNDTLVGGQGNDVLIGGQGDDVLYGNEGLNTFVFNPGDTDFKPGVSTGDVVMDFATGTSRIDFASGPAGTAANFGATATTATSFAAIQAAAQALIGGGDTYAFVANGVDGYLFTTGGSGTSITDAVKLAGAGTVGAVKYTDIAHGALG